MTDFLDYSLNAIFSTKNEKEKKEKFSQFLEFYKYKFPHDILNNILIWIENNTQEKEQSMAYAQLKKAYLNHWKKNISLEDIKTIEKFYSFLSLGEKTLLDNFIKKENLSSPLLNSPLTESEEFTLALKNLKQRNLEPIRNYLNGVDNISNNFYSRLRDALRQNYSNIYHSDLLEIAYTKTKQTYYSFYTNELDLFIKPSFFKTLCLNRLKDETYTYSDNLNYEITHIIFEKFIDCEITNTDNSELNHDERFSLCVNSFLKILDRALNINVYKNLNLDKKEFNNFFENIEFVMSTHTFLKKYCAENNINNVRALFSIYNERKNEKFEHADKMIMEYLLNSTLLEKNNTLSKIHKI